MRYFLLIPLTAGIDMSAAVVDQVRSNPCAVTPPKPKAPRSTLNVDAGRIPH
jgi:hypothetical protein